MTLYKGPHSLFRALAPKYRLNKAEYLQLYNIRPTTQVMLDLVIEEVCIAYYIHNYRNTELHKLPPTLNSTVPPSFRMASIAKPGSFAD